jgi:hypothetical protein
VVLGVTPLRVGQEASWLDQIARDEYYAGKGRVARLVATAEATSPADAPRRAVRFMRPPAAATA